VRDVNPMPALDPQTADAMGRLLRERREQLTQAAWNVVSRQASDRRDAALSPEARAAATLLAEIQSALLQRQNRQLAEIDAALGRLERGEYGFCQDCGAPIGLARLRTLPFASRCTPCARCAAFRAHRATRAVVATVATPSPAGLASPSA
jgi:RNA polymerase-binding protein DksA